MNPEQILKQLIEDVENPDISNHQATIDAVRSAKILFGGSNGIEKRSPEAKAPRIGGEGKAGPKGAGRNGKVDGRSKAARSARAKGNSGANGSGVSTADETQIGNGHI